MKVSAVKNGKMSFEISQDGHKFNVDADEKFGGTNKGPSPKGLLLSGLIGCTGMDVSAILSKMKIEYSNFSVEAETEYTDEHPKVFKDITIKYIFAGENIDPKKVKRAVELSETRYCGVSEMLRNNRKISSEIYINNEKI